MKTKLSENKTFGITLAVLLTCLPAFSMMLQADMDQLVEYSESVVSGRVVSLDMHWLDGPHSIIVTDVGFLVDEVWMGTQQQPGQKVMLRVVGGVVDGLRLHQEHEPEFKLEEAAILFLKTRTDGHLGIPHGEQGVYQIHSDQVSGHIPELKTIASFRSALETCKQNLGRP